MAEGEIVLAGSERSRSSFVLRSSFAITFTLEETRVVCHWRNSQHRRIRIFCAFASSMTGVPMT